MEKYIIGIDTGGTYTDGVILTLQSHRILAKAKVPTSHFDLAHGTGKVLAQLLEQSGAVPGDILSMAISSTLATNSVVENKGARVAVIVIGYVRHFKLPVKAVVFVKGGHTISGEEEEPLDLDYLVNLVENLKHEVDAYGVCSAMSMINPAHELVTEKAISLLDPKPVFCSHRISTLNGMHERAATAGLHAKLMPVMTDFIRGVEKAMAELRLDCPAVVIGGNGRALESQRAITEAGMTVASGPACTAHFGAAHTTEKALVIDVGGTTTDIAMVENGAPLLAADGCQIGLWKTHVEAVDMQTTGIGGDSHVHVADSGDVSVGPNRVTPLSMTEHGDYPPERWLGTDTRSRLIVFRKEAMAQPHGSEIAALLQETGQLTPAEIRQRTGLGGIPLDVELEHLTRKQLIFECGFTPTDALHVLGEINLGDRNAALSGAMILGQALAMNAEDFSRLVLLRTEEKIENMIIDYVIQRSWGNSLAGFISERNSHPILGVDFSIRVPIIGIGAAARFLLPRVAERLRTTAIFPEHCEVGNAIGAAMIGAMIGR